MFFCQNNTAFKILGLATLDAIMIIIIIIIIIIILLLLLLLLL